MKKLEENNIISKELWLDYLDEFRATRHVFIHNYVIFLEWEEMKETVLMAEETWKKTKKEILMYLENINEEN